jgi:hypothetical protein
MPTVCRKIGHITARVAGAPPHADYKFVQAFGESWRLGISARREAEARGLDWVWVHGRKGDAALVVWASNPLAPGAVMIGQAFAEDNDA